MTDARVPPFTVAQATVAIAGAAVRFPVHRIYCVGRNYAAHVREIGANPEREPPCFFMKPADAVVDNGRLRGQTPVEIFLMIQSPAKVPFSFS